MIGMKFVANESKKDENHFGWQTIELASEPILSRVVHRNVNDEWREHLQDHNATKVAAHYHTVFAICDGDFVELDWEEFCELIGECVYSLEGSK